MLYPKFAHAIDAFLTFFLMQHLHVCAIRFDANHTRWAHLFTEEVLHPRNGQSYKRFAHLLLDMATAKCRVISRQVGSKLDLESPFVERSLAAASKKVGVTLALGTTPKVTAFAIQVSEVESFCAPKLKSGNTLVVQQMQVEGNSEVSDQRIDLLRYFIGSREVWQRRLSGGWLDAQRCFHNDVHGFVILSSTVDTLLLAFNLKSGAVFSERYLLRILP